MGWAPVGDDHFYFAHSYAVVTPAATAWSEGIVAEARSGSFVGCQFHPEKSARPAPATSRPCSRRRDASPSPDSPASTSRAPRRQGVNFKRLLGTVGDPVELGSLYSDAAADELVFLDITATLDDRSTLVELVRQVAERLAIPFTVGGGVRSYTDAEALLAAGADKVGVNSAALAQPELLTELADRLGSQAVVIAIDVDRGRCGRAPGRRRRARDAVEWAREAQERGRARYS